MPCQRLAAPQGLINSNRLQASNHFYQVDFSPHDCASRKPNRGLRRQDRRTVESVGPLESRSQVCTVTHDCVVESTPRANVPNDSNSSVKTDPLLQPAAAKGVYLRRIHFEQSCTTGQCSPHCV